MKKVFLTAMLLSSMGMAFAQTATTWDDATDTNVAKGCPVTVSQVSNGSADLITDGNLGTTCQFGAADTKTEWAIIDLGFGYDIEKVSVTTNGDRKDKVYAIYGATAASNPDMNEGLNGWTKLYETEDLWGDEEYFIDRDSKFLNTASTTLTYAVEATGIRYIKYQAVTRVGTDGWGAGIGEIRVASNTVNNERFVVDHITIDRVPTAVYVGQTENITFSAYNTMGTALDLDPTKLSATSKNPATATAAPAGTQVAVTGVAPGTAEIEITYDGKVVSAFVTVNAAMSAAPVPTVDAESVLAFYSDSYTCIGYGWYDWGGGFGKTFTINGNNCWNIPEFRYQGSQFPDQDVTDYDFFHIDIYPTVATTIGIVPITIQPQGGNSPERGVTTEELTPNQWNSIDVPMADFVENGVLNLDRLYQIKYIKSISKEGAELNCDGNLGIFFDNVYFYKAAGMAEPTISAVAQNVTSTGAEIAYNVTIPAALEGATVKVYVNDAEATASPVALTGLNPSTSYSYDVYATATKDGETVESKHVTVSFTTKRDASADAVYYGVAHIELKNAYLPGENAETDRRTFELYADYTITYTTESKLVVAIDLADMPNVVGLVKNVCIPELKDLVKEGETTVWSATFDGPFDEKVAMNNFYFRFAYAGGEALPHVNDYSTGDTNSYVLYDEVGYKKAYAFEAAKAEYTRENIGANWQAICLPFDVAAEVWGDSYTVIKLHSEQNVEEDVIIFEYLGEDEAMEANTPYLIKAKEGVEDLHLYAEDATVKAADAKTVTEGVVKLIGTLTSVDLSNESAMVYGLKDGEFHHPGTNVKTMKAFRAYLELPSANAAMLKVRINSEMDAIKGINVEKAADNVFYNLNGQRVDYPTAGIYILNGQKVIIR